MRKVIEKPFGKVEVEVKEDASVVVRFNGLEAEGRLGRFPVRGGKTIYAVVPGQPVKAAIEEAVGCSFKGIGMNEATWRELWEAREQAGDRLAMQAYERAEKFKLTRLGFGYTPELEPAMKLPQVVKEEFWPPKEVAEELEKVAVRLLDERDKLDILKEEPWESGYLKAMVDGDLVRRMIEEVKERRRQRTEEKERKEREAFEEAKRTGKPVLLEKYTTEHEGPEPDCDLDIIYVYAMPDGTKKTRRVHTF